MLMEAKLKIIKNKIQVVEENKPFLFFSIISNKNIIHMKINNGILIFNNLSAGSKTKTVTNKYMAIRNNLFNIYFFL